MTREREVKLAAFPRFSLPALDGVADGITATDVPARHLDATYFDTADLALARWGVSLRHRVGDGPGWTVKLPEGKEGPALVRRELSFEGASGSVPAPVSDLVRAYARSRPLKPVARLRTIRRGFELRDAEGHRVAEVVDDEVSVYEGRRVAARFREIEVEIYDEAPPDLLEEVIDRLRAAGAGAPDPVPKVVRALGARATEPADVVVTSPDDDGTVGDVVRAAIADSVTRILRHDPGVRIGDDPEDVHQARVGTRRLRSDLRTFRSILEPEWLAARRAELAWLADLLGHVRDADVLLDRLRACTKRLPEHDAAGVSALIRRLATDRDEARAALLAAMASPRYVRLLDDLVDAARAPALLPDASEPAAIALPRFVRGPWRHLAKAVGELGEVPADDELHRVRILAKRARYAAEATASVIGKPAVRFADRIAAVQTVLGDHQDACVAEAWLRTAAASTDAAHAFVAGELAAQQRLDAAEHRADWPAAWKDANRRKLRAWLD
jgi:CHAD domain-containing protein